MNPKDYRSRLGQGKVSSIACTKLTQNDFCDEVDRHAFPIINTVACQLGGIGRVQPELREQRKIPAEILSKLESDCKYAVHHQYGD